MRNKIANGLFDKMETLYNKSKKYFTPISLSFFIIFLLLGCEKNEINSSKKLTDGFCLMINDEVVLNHSDIDYYDFSEHEVHVNNKVTFPEDTIKSGTFTIYADLDSIYSGHIIPSYSSYLFPGPLIYSQPLLIYSTYFPIDCVRMMDTLGNITPDPRGDERIIEALKKHNQFRE